MSGNNKADMAVGEEITDGNSSPFGKCFTCLSLYVQRERQREREERWMYMLAPL